MVRIIIPNELIEIAVMKRYPTLILAGPGNWYEEACRYLAEKYGDKDILAVVHCSLNQQNSISNLNHILWRRIEGYKKAERQQEWFDFYLDFLEKFAEPNTCRPVIWIPAEKVGEYPTKNHEYEYTLEAFEPVRQLASAGLDATVGIDPKFTGWATILNLLQMEFGFDGKISTQTSLRATIDAALLYMNV